MSFQINHHYHVGNDNASLNTTQSASGLLINRDNANNDNSLTALPSAPDYRQEHQPIKFKDALKIPRVITYALSYSCLKSVNYVMFFWLPYYLDNDFSDSSANNLSMLFDVGQIFGGWACGWISDWLNKRVPSVFISLILSSIPVFLLRVHSTSFIYVGALCLLSGFFVGGPANLISSAIAADLGKHKSLKGNAQALSTVSGIIEGSGSAGAAVMLYLVSWISDVSWNLVFVVLAIMLACSAVFLIGIFKEDMMDLKKYGRSKFNKLHDDEVDPPTDNESDVADAPK